MTEGTRYRSRIDELVLKSSFSGLKIAREMGISKNRIIALRMAKDANVSTYDLASCSDAIRRLGGDVGFDSDGGFAVITETCSHCDFIQTVNRRFEEQEELIQMLIKKLGLKDERRNQNS